MRKRAVLIGVLLVLGLAGAAIAFGVGSDSWRYKMTVVVETPEGLKTGSAVREVTVHGGLKLTPEMLPLIEVKGEAVVVDLGKRGVLFMLVNGDYGADILFKLFSGKHKAGKVTLTPDQYPNFARFRNLNDPKTIENVRATGDKRTDKIRKADPRRPIVDFKDAFGEGVSLKDVTIEITSEPVTWGVQKYLPWLKDIYGYISGKPISGQEWYERVDSGDFQRRP